jgi:hypothetical protein
MNLIKTFSSKVSQPQNSLTSLLLFAVKPVESSCPFTLIDKQTWVTLTKLLV